MLVDAGGCAARDCCCALAAAQVALVPVAPGDADPVRNYGLIARLNAARMANPGLRVLFVALGDGAPQALRTVQAYAREVMSGHVAATVLDAAALRDDGSLAALGDEVFGQRH
ncbi:hypothetical protein [uncultured Massilia sp.]|uniref:hypothetical protein n=1 Tax=uncultured Massilia sp. TaxID=169973 RepID=UPI0025ECC5AA|nr:hypothetical protein [uncultured Massilia sp.]